MTIQSGIRLARHTTLTVALVALVAAAASAQERRPEDACAWLAREALNGGYVVNAQSVAAGALRLPGVAATPSEAGLPAFCRVQAVLTPVAGSRIAVEVWLPHSGWNGRFQGVGNRRWGGTINYALLRDALAAGYAAANTDTGHQGVAPDRMMPRSCATIG